MNKFSRPRLGIIIHRYGENLTGGSESHCRQVAERLVPFYDVEVLTTCAVDHLSWRNELPESETRLNGVTVRRFPTEHERNLEKFHLIYDRIFLTQLDEAQQYEMVRWQGPYCPKLVSYVEANRQNYDAFIAFTYLYYPAIHCLPLLKSKAVFVPTAHDEASLYLTILDDLFRQTPHIFFNTEEEQFLLQRRFGLPDSVGAVVGLGLNDPNPGQYDDAWEPLENELADKFVLTFVGRIENGKGCDELLEFFLRFVTEEKRRDLLLLMLGRRTMPFQGHPQVLCPGYVSEFVKYQALERTHVAVCPSPFESLCMAALESWQHAKPLLANGKSPVLLGHCIRSNGGLWYTSYQEFREALRLLMERDDIRLALGRSGRRYVAGTYRWDTVIRTYREVIDRITEQGTL